MLAGSFETNRCDEKKIDFSGNLGIAISDVKLHLNHMQTIIYAII